MDMPPQPSLTHHQKIMLNSVMLSTASQDPFMFVNIETVKFWYSMANVNQAPQCWAVRKGPTRAYQALSPPHQCSSCPYLHKGADTVSDSVNTWSKFKDKQGGPALVLQLKLEGNHFDLMRTASVDFLLCRGPAAACCSGSDLCRCGRLLSDGCKTSRNNPPSDLLLNLKTEIIQGGGKKGIWRR